MTRRLGVLVVLAVSASAMAAPPAKKTATKPAPAKTEPAQPAVDPAQPEAPAQDAPPAEDDFTAKYPRITGPKLVDLGNDSEIDLPAGMVLFEKAAAVEMVKKGGNSGEGVVAVVLQPGKDWAVLISFQDVGYVTDSDADDLKPDELLASYREGTVAQNDRRRSMGVPEMFVDGWSENPRYERPTHHLTWGLDAHDANGKIINFMTRTLGRNGFLEVQLVDAPATIAQSKNDIAPIIAGTRFKAGARYEDHKSEDKSSGMGLRALVLGGAGVAVLKGGGIFLKLLLVFKKGFIVLVAGIGGFFKWLFGRKKKDQFVPPPTDDVPPAPPADPNVG